MLPEADWSMGNYYFYFMIIFNYFLEKQYVDIKN